MGDTGRDPDGEMAETAIDEEDEDGEGGGEVQVQCSRLGSKLTQQLTSYLCDICKFLHCVLIFSAGSRDYPRWRCKPCHAALTFYDKVLDSKNISKRDFKKSERRKYELFVFRLRISHADDPPELVAKSFNHSLQDRKKQHGVFFETVSRENASETKENIGWANYREFLGYHCLFLLYSRPEAEQLWIDSTKPGTTVKHRLNSRKETTVCISMMATSAQIEKHSSVRGLKRAEVCDDDDELDEFMSEKKLKVSDHKEPDAAVSLMGFNPFAADATSKQPDFEVDALAQGANPGCHFVHGWS